MHPISNKNSAPSSFRQPKRPFFITNYSSSFSQKSKLAKILEVVHCKIFFSNEVSFDICKIKPHFPISNSAYNSFLSKISCVIYGNGFVVWILCLPPKKDCRHVLITHTRVDNAHVPYYREKSNHLACSFHHQTLPFWVSCTQVLRLFLDSAHFLLDNRLALSKIIGSGWYWATKKLEVSAPRILTKMKTFSIPLSVVMPTPQLIISKVAQEILPFSSHAVSGSLPN